MDLVFNALPDVFSYQSLRHVSYDAPWLNDNNKRGKKQQAQQQQRQQLQRSAPVAVKARSNGGCSGSPKDSCPLCLEKHRRPLATYIRSKSRQDRRDDAAIREEEEEEEQEQPQPQAEENTRPGGKQ